LPAASADADEDLFGGLYDIEEDNDELDNSPLQLPPAQKQPQQQQLEEASEGEGELGMVQVAQLLNALPSTPFSSVILNSTRR